MTDNERVAQGLENCDWSGAPIGNKAIIQHAIDLLRATPADQEPVAWMHERDGKRFVTLQAPVHDTAGNWKSFPLVVAAPQPAQKVSDTVRDADYSDKLMRALAACRDALPVPDQGSALEGDWAAAIGDPLSVPHYVSAYLADRDTQSVRDAVIEECAMVCEESSMTAIAETYERYARYSKECADRIRALKSAPPQKPVSED